MGTADRLRPVWLMAFTALFVATPLLPSEAVTSNSAVPVFAMLWAVLLLGWSLAFIVSPRLRLRGGWTLVAILVFLSWHTVSALWMMPHGQPRATLNTMWQWITFGVLFFLGRQLIVSAKECRAICAVGITLAVGLSLHGYDQYFHSFPAFRRAYKTNPELELSKAGVIAPPGSPQRELFESRLFSTEPLATFSLTNSLAGFLTPWLLVSSGVVISGRGVRRSAGRLILCGAPVLIAGCWLLTKSRTAWLATAIGFGLLLMYGRSQGWRPGWRTILGAVLFVVVLVGLATYVGGLDWLVLAESSKAFRYRLEYWQATQQLVADHLWYGVGAGNFQQYYTAYKLPQASETIADPHNFVLEIWANAGTPALLAFAGVLVAAGWQLQRHPAMGQETPSSIDEDETPRTPSDDSSEATGSWPNFISGDSGTRAIYFGGLIGFILAFPIGVMVGYLPDLVILLICLPAAVLFQVAFYPWVAAGRLRPSITGVAIFALSINLLAAGGIGFAGVASSFWLLLVITLTLANVEESPHELSKPIGTIAAGLTVALALAAYATAYSPVLKAEEKVAEARLYLEQARYAAAEASLWEATVADRFDVRPWEQLAELRFQRWKAAPNLPEFQRFKEASNEMLRLNPRSSRTRAQVGNQLLTAYRLTADQSKLEEAIGHYRAAVDLHPNFSFLRAQLAWALHLANSPESAAQAEMALQLDALNPHREQDLARRTIVDPGPVPNIATAPGPDLPSEAQNAEQVMEFLRKS
jgi:hypothetical protein